MSVLSTSANRRSLTAQIACVEREIGMRRNVYQRKVSRGELRAAEADYMIGDMLAVRDTLRWLERNAEAVKAVHAQIAEAERAAAAQADETSA